MKRCVSLVRKTLVRVSKQKKNYMCAVVVLYNTALPMHKKRKKKQTNGHFRGA